MAGTIYDELRDALAEFKAFLQNQASTVGPVIKSLATVVPQINDLIDKPIALLQALKVEIEKISNLVPAEANTALEYAQKLKGFVQALQAILPGEDGTINDVSNVADIIAGLPSLSNIKAELDTLIDEIIALLQGMQSA
jgi:hypothetical protein